MTDFRPPIERTPQRPDIPATRLSSPRPEQPGAKLAAAATATAAQWLHTCSRILHEQPLSFEQSTNNQYQQPAQQGYAQPSYQSRGAPGNADLTTNGLVHQFSHQNLGCAARGNQYARQPAGGAQRPRTAGSTGVQQNYYNSAAAPVVPQQPGLELALERNLDKYGPLTHNNDISEC
ncbi:hypothetical protein VE03_10340 [Pseudogymnoascus sp. 23342-1-I1]|nr:hypothetical protein VE03_10340 [Pseudogymnoascus sp. 23342-1-I1]